MKKTYRVIWAVCIAAMLSLVAVYPGVAGSYYVNAASGNDGNSGNQANPFKTITKAMSVAVSGDSVIVLPGEYNGSLGESFPITMTSGVKLVSSSGAEATVIDANGAMARVFDCQCSASTLIEGFTITGGMNVGNTSSNFTARGGAIYCNSNDSTVIRRNIIAGNTVVGYQGQSSVFLNGGNAYGGAIYITSASPTIVDNVICFNTASGGNGFGYGGGNSGQGYDGGTGQSGGIDATYANAMNIVNNTFYGNTANGGTGGATNNYPTFTGGNGGPGIIGALSAGTNVVVKNNIFAKNTAVAGLVGAGGDHDGTGSFGGVLGTPTTISYNLFYSNIATTSDSTGIVGTNAMTDQDPLFHGPRNLHLRTASPAVNTGTSSGAPSTDLDGKSRTGNPDIGAYEAPSGTPATNTVNNPALSTDVPVGSGVSVNFSSFSGGYVAVDYFSTGRTGTTPTLHASPYFWTVATNAAAATGTITFDWSGITGNGVNNPSTVSLLRRSGGTQPWTVVGGTTQSGTHITANVSGFSDFALGGGGDNPLSVKNESRPLTFKLQQNYPNPFNPSTTIEFSVEKTEHATVKIYNMLGQEVAILFDGMAEPGQFHRLNFDGSKYSNGLYYYRIVTASHTDVKKMLMIK